MVARTSLWLMACGIMLLCVAVPHASTHPTPDASPQGVQPYYPQQQPQHYYPSYDEEEIVEEDEDSGKINLQDFEPVLAEKVVDAETKHLNSRLIELAILLGYVFFLYHIFRPENYFPTVKRDLDDGHYTFNYYNQLSNGIMSDAFTLIMNSVDPVEMGLDMLSVDEKECRHRLVCEARHMVANVPFLDKIAQQHGWLLGSVEGYKEALSEGRTGGDCGRKFSQCPSTQLSRFYNLL